MSPRHLNAFKNVFQLKKTLFKKTYTEINFEPLSAFLYL